MYDPTFPSFSLSVHSFVMIIMMMEWSLTPQPSLPSFLPPSTPSALSTLLIYDTPVFTPGKRYYEAHPRPPTRPSHSIDTGLCERNKDSGCGIEK